MSGSSVNMFTTIEENGTEEDIARLGPARDRNKRLS